MRSNAARLLPEFREFQRRNGAPSHYRHLAITSQMTSSPFGMPWGDIRGMGNRLRHAYDRVSLGVIWNAARHDVPGLAVDARRALAQLRGPNQPTNPSQEA
jgi:Protein of unknown function DUF86